MALRGVRFFTGLRHSEEFALQVEDCDLETRKINVTKAVVEEEMKNRTKSNQDREITLCPRAVQVLRAQLALRERMAAAGNINHNFVFFSAVGEPWETTYPLPLDGSAFNTAGPVPEAL